MESDKENRMKQSKIPLPKRPLPLMDKAILKWKKLVGTRQPLQTINLQSEAGCSAKSDENCPVKVNARYVTLRDANEDLDWNFNVFKDTTNQPETAKTKASELDAFLNQARSCFEDKKTVTPVKTLEPSRVRNIKRSLKRPHSRELQTISPESNCGKGEERHKRRLYFQEYERKLLPDPLKETYMVSLTRHYIPDTFTYLLVTEDKSPTPKLSCITRACVINWLMKINGPDRSLATVQAAVWYLDSVASRTEVKIDQLQLVAAASYWIAQKLHGAASSAKKLVKCSSQAFTAGRLIRAEKAIIKLLAFPRVPVVPQDFITYFSWHCEKFNGEVIEMAASFICMCSLIVDKSLCNVYPSVIGAASVYNALFLLRKRELVMKLNLNSIFRMTESKAPSLQHICSIQRKAIRQLAFPLYEYKTPFEHYNIPPYFIAQKIIESANEILARKKASIAITSSDLSMSSM